jgi:hypothetical protein
MKKKYKPKAKNELALKTYIKNATKKSNSGHRRDNSSKR